MGRLACEKGLSLLTDFGWASADVRMYVHTHTHTVSQSVMLSNRGTKILLMKDKLLFSSRD